MSRWDDVVDHNVPRFTSSDYLNYDDLNNIEDLVEELNELYNINLLDITTMGASTGSFRISNETIENGTTDSSTSARLQILLMSNRNISRILNLPVNLQIRRTYSVTFKTSPYEDEIRLRHYGNQTNISTDTLISLEPNKFYTISFILLNNDPSQQYGLRIGNIQIEEGKIAHPYQSHNDYVKTTWVLNQDRILDTDFQNIEDELDKYNVMYNLGYKKKNWTSGIPINKTISYKDINKWLDEIYYGFNLYYAPRVVRKAGTFRASDEIKQLNIVEEE